MEKPDTWLFIVDTISLVISIMSDTGNLFSRMSDSGETPTQFINRAFSYINQKSNAQLNGLSSRPFFITVGTNTRLFDGYGDAINFDEIKKDGWVSTQINQKLNPKCLSLLSQSPSGISSFSEIPFRWYIHVHTFSLVSFSLSSSMIASTASRWYSPSAG